MAPIETSPTSVSMSSPARIRETAAHQEEDDECRPRPEDLPDDTPVDLEVAKLATNIDAVLVRLDRELVGLVPVKTRVREIADLLVVDRLP